MRLRLLRCWCDMGKPAISGRSGRAEAAYRSCRRLAGAVVAASLLAAAVQAQTPAQVAPPAAGDLRSVQESLDRIAASLRLLAEQSARRDVLGVLSDRIAAAERRLESLEAELRVRRDGKARLEGALADLHENLVGLTEMEKLDTGGSAGDAFAAERRRLTESVATASEELLRFSDETAQLEREVAERQAALARMDERLDRLLDTELERLERE